MTAVMARIRITIDCEEEFKRAFLAAADERGLSPQELFEQVVADHFGENLSRVRSFMPNSDQPPPPKKRRPKSSD